MASTDLRATITVGCPGMCGPTGSPACGGEEVVADMGTWADTTVSVAPCSHLVAQGWEGPQVVEFKSRAGYLEPTGTRQVVRHTDGLVWIG